MTVSSTDKNIMHLFEHCPCCGKARGLGEYGLGEDQRIAESGEYIKPTSATYDLGLKMNIEMCDCSWDMNDGLPDFGYLFDYYALDYDYGPDYNGICYADIWWTDRRNHNNDGIYYQKDYQVGECQWCEGATDSDRYFYCDMECAATAYIKDAYGDYDEHTDAFKVLSEVVQSAEPPILIDNLHFLTIRDNDPGHITFKVDTPLQEVLQHSVECFELDVDSFDQYSY